METCTGVVTTSFTKTRNSRAKKTPDSVKRKTVGYHKLATLISISKKFLFLVANKYYKRKIVLFNILEWKSA